MFGDVMRKGGIEKTTLLGKVQGKRKWGRLTKSLFANFCHVMTRDVHAYVCLKLWTELSHFVMQVLFYCHLLYILSFNKILRNETTFMVWIGFISICCSKVAILQRVAQNAKSCSKAAEHNLFMPRGGGGGTPI